MSSTRKLGFVLGACGHCSRIKQKCDGENPCSRCRRFAVDCLRKGARKSSAGVADPGVNLAQGESETSVLRRRAVVIKRTRTGCVSCKTRRKKCDEVLPKCGDCKRLNLICERIGQTSKEPPQKSFSPASSESSLTDTTHALLSPSKPPETPQHHSEIAWPDGREEFQENEDTAPPIVKTAAQSIVIVYRAKSPSFTFERPISTIHFDITAPHDQHLLRHFIRVVSRTLSIVHEDDANPFIKLIVPLAGSSKVVVESLLALSASHLRRVYPQILQRGLSHQSKALNSLNSIISNNKKGSSDETLAAVLLLCMTEICDGNSTKWAWHISAAQTIIRSKPKAEPSSTTWKFPLAMFGYVDSVITISKCQAPLITLEELASCSDSILPQQREESYTSHKDALFGIAQPLFNIIGKISALANRRKDRVDEISDLWFRQSATAIEKSLREWQPPPTSTHIQNQKHNRDDMLHAAYAIKWASILRLHQVVEGYFLTDPIVREATSNILMYISHIRFGSPVESILIFPLVMAAAGCMSDEERVCVRQRWMVMERTIGFENLARAREMVEAVWGKVDEGRETGENQGGLTVNWAQIRYYDFPGVVLL